MNPGDCVNVSGMVTRLNSELKAIRSGFEDFPGILVERRANGFWVVRMTETDYHFLAHETVLEVSQDLGHDCGKPLNIH